MEKIPVTIITGFLGAGKTTLLNHLIRKHPGKKFAIIENEFGEVGIDDALVVDVDAGIFEMTNGCICCTLNDALVDTLFSLLESGRPFDHLLIETTGIAEPDGVAAAFISDPMIQQAFRLDATICLADAQHLEEQFGEREEVRRQLTFADAIILNKAGTVAAPRKEALKDLLEQVNPLARVLEADFGEVEADLLSLHAYDNGEVESKLSALVEAAHIHRHADIVSHSFQIDEPFDFLRFRHWANVLLMVQGARIYRIKGLLHFQDMDERMIFQSVRQMHVFQRSKPWSPGEARQSKLVFIGPGLERAPLEKSLRSCLAR